MDRQVPHPRPLLSQPQHRGHSAVFGLSCRGQGGSWRAREVPGLPGSETPSRGCVETLTTLGCSLPLPQRPSSRTEPSPWAKYLAASWVFWRKGYLVVHSFLHSFIHSVSYSCILCKFNGHQLWATHSSLLRTQRGRGGGCYHAATS